MSEKQEFAVLSKPNVLNPVVSTFMYHVTDPLQVLTLINPTITLPFTLHPHWKSIFTWTKKLFTSCLSCMAPTPNSNLLSVALLRLSAMRFENFCQQLTSNQVTICSMPKTSLHNHPLPPQLPPTGLLFCSIIIMEQKCLRAGIFSSC